MLELPTSRAMLATARPSCYIFLLYLFYCSGEQILCKNSASKSRHTYRVRQTVTDATDHATLASDIAGIVFVNGSDRIRPHEVLMQVGNH